MFMQEFVNLSVLKKEILTYDRWRFQCNVSRSIQTQDRRPARTVPPVLNCGGGQDSQYGRQTANKVLGDGWRQIPSQDCSEHDHDRGASPQSQESPAWPV